MLLESPICDFGWKAPEFTLPDLDGSSVSLAQSYGKNGVLIAFICNHCPYVQAIIERLVADANLLRADGIHTLAIMPNDFHSHPADSPPKMKEFAAQHHFTFPYLLDETQNVARAYHAICTPDFFGFNRKGELQYRGRLDDVAMRDRSHRTAELVEAMRLIAESGNGPADQTASIGCSIKWHESANDN